MNLFRTTVYRLQVGAYETFAEAETRLAELHAIPLEQEASIEEVSGPYQFKVRVGNFVTYEQAKAYEATYEPKYGDGFVISTTLTDQEMTLKGLAPKPSLHDTLLSGFTPIEGIDEAIIIEEAATLTDQANQLPDRMARNAELEKALPYLLTLAESYPESASAPWVRNVLGAYYTQEYYIENHRRRISGEKVASVTEESAAKAALQQYEETMANYADSDFVEDALYRIASMKFALTKSGLQKQRQKEAIAAYENYLAAYPEGKYSGRARMSISGLKFEMAKSGWETYENAYAAMTETLASENLALGDRGRTQLMMAEVQAYYFKDQNAVLSILDQMDTGPGQDRAALAGGMYMRAEAYRTLGDFAGAANVYAEILDRFKNKDSFWDFDLHPICLDALGNCQMKLNDWDGAEASYHRLKRDWPDDPRGLQCDRYLDQIETKRSSN